MLVYDLGFFNGDDTDYYLRKGCSVVAVEANTELAESGLRRFSINSDKFTMLNAVFCNQDNGVAKFYINRDNPECSTCDKDKTKWWDCKPIVKEIPAISLIYLLTKHGFPNYIKTDIEGFDYLVLEQLLEMRFRPEYLSFELSRFDYYKTFSMLYVLGYKKFKLVNQLKNNGKIDRAINYPFGEFHSGLFGEDLFRDGFLNFDEALTQYMKYKEIKGIDNENLALGWLDIHASF